MRKCSKKEITCTAAAAKLLQSCPPLWDPIDGSPPGSPVPGILQARTLEWVARVKSLSRVRLLATPWTAAGPKDDGLANMMGWKPAVYQAERCGKGSYH